jgi:hypothetical protein
MRKQLLKALATISFLIAVAIVPVRSAQAQTLAYRVRANIPFDFIVADKTFPAGEYYIYRTRQYSGDDVVTVGCGRPHARRAVDDHSANLKSEKAGHGDIPSLRKSALSFPGLGSRQQHRAELFEIGQ